MSAVSDVRVTTLVRAEGQRLLAGGLLVVGVGSLTVGARQLARSSSGAEEVTYLISGGLVGLAAVVAAVASFLSADVNDLFRKLQRINLLRAGDLVPTPLEAIARAQAGETPDRGQGADALRRPGRPSLAWRIGSICVLGLGALLVVIGWKHAARTADLGRALDGLVLSLLGVLVGVAALGALALRSYAELRRYQREVLQPILPAAEGSRELSAPAEPAEPASDDRWIAPGLTRFHRRRCPALAGAATPAHPAPSISGLEACLLCHPEES